MARLEASHAVHELDSKRTSRHTRKEILSCIAHQQNIGQKQILPFKPQLLQRKEARDSGTTGRQAAFVLRGVWRRPNMKAREAVAILQGLWLQGVWWQSISVQRAVASSMYRLRLRFRF